MTGVLHWSKLLKLRREVIASDGGVGDLQMSLHKAVYQTVDVPYRDVGYYAEITQPTPNLVGFLGRVARRLSAASEVTALYHLDQGMGGGKSHALVGLYHMAASPQVFLATEIGGAVKAEAEAGGDHIDLTGTRVVCLTADHFSPGRPTELFGPAVNLFERFLWLLLDKDRERWDQFVAMGPNKSTLQQALAEAGCPVLILLDELMDYIMALSDASVVDSMPGEKAFLSALMDACDDVPRVVCVVVMMRSEFDPEGYTPLAEDCREYITRRLNRNGTTVAVTETGDFASIIRRRIFERLQDTLPSNELVKGHERIVAADPAWGRQVLDKLGPGKGVAWLTDRIVETYPFHPVLMDLVQDEWGKVQGFQRVRSTVAIFALTTLYWSRVVDEGGWAPPLIGVGDIPLRVALEEVLSSGLLLGNDRAIQGYRAVATTDIVSAEGTGGRAVAIDARLAQSKVEAGQPNPAVRMATALYCYSLVARGQGRRGATKAELMAALLIPTDVKASPFAAVEEIFYAVTGDDGLGALEVIKPSNAPERYWLTIKQTLRMFFNSAKAAVHDDDKLALVWETAQRQATKGQFEELLFVEQPRPDQRLIDVAGQIESQGNRLVVLDPREWTLLNGVDDKSRETVRRLLGLGQGALVVDNAASCVIALLNTQRRRYAVAAAETVLTWRLVYSQVVEDDERAEVSRQLEAAEKELKTSVRSAFQHYAYLVRQGEDLDVQVSRFDDDKDSSLTGDDVWSALVLAGRAVGDYYDPTEKRRKHRALGEAYVAALLDSFDRHLTLKDVTTSFYQNPAFPLVPSLQEIRQVIFDLVQPAGQQGDNTGGWELIDGAGVRLEPQNPGQLAINSIQQQLRRARAIGAAEEPGVNEVPGSKETDNGGHLGGTSDATAKSDDLSSGAKEPTAYSSYRLDLINRSLADVAKREAIQKVLMWLHSKLDDDGLDPQLITLRIELNAAVSEALASELEQRAKGMDAKWAVEESL